MMIHLSGQTERRTLPELIELIPGKGCYGEGNRMSGRTNNVRHIPLNLDVLKNMCRKAIRQKSIPRKRRFRLEETAAEGLAE